MNFYISRPDYHQNPAGQAAQPAVQPVVQPATQASTEAVPEGSCPVCHHCPSLPSSESAYDLVTGKPWSPLTVARDLVLRGLLIGGGMAVYNAAFDIEDEYVIQKAIAGSAGIEVFVLAWTWLKRPSK